MKFQYLQINHALLQEWKKHEEFLKIFQILLSKSNI